MAARSKYEEEQLRCLWGDLEYLKAQITPRDKRMRILKKKSAMPPAQNPEEIKLWRNVVKLPPTLVYDSERRVAEVEEQKRKVETAKIAIDTLGVQRNQGVVRACLRMMLVLPCKGSIEAWVSAMGREVKGMWPASLWCSVFILDP